MTVEVDVDDARRFADQMVVYGENLEAPGLQLSDDRIHLGPEQNEVSHRDSLASGAGLLESGPGAQGERGLEAHIADHHAQVRTGPTDSVHIAGHVLARLPDDSVHNLPAGALRAGPVCAEQQEQRRRDPEMFHVLASLGFLRKDP